MRQAWYSIFLILLFTACTQEQVVIQVVEVDGKSTSPEITPSAQAPGTDSGPNATSFWLKDRHSGAANGLAAYKEVSADLIYSTANFALYRQSALPSGYSLSDDTSLKSVIDLLQANYANIKSIYGAGTMPNVQNSGRIVVLAVDIRDNFSGSNSAFIAGFVAPRDLYSDNYTQALLSDVELIASTSATTIAKLGGRSNENNLMYLDIAPGLTGAAHGGDKTAALEAMKDTALHELSHLATWNKRVKENELSELPFWISEGIAELAPKVAANRKSSLKARFERQTSSSIQAWLKTGISLTNADQDCPHTESCYVQSALFFSYLSQQKTDNNWLSAVTSSSDPVQAIISQGDLATDLRRFQQLVLMDALGKNLNSFINSAGEDKLTAAQATLAFPHSGFDGRDGFRQLVVSVADEQPSCLAPASAAYFFSSPATNESFIVENGFSVTRLVHSASNLDVREFDAGQLVAISSGQQVHLILHNTESAGTCKSINITIPLTQRNLYAWLGNNATEWQTGIGAGESSTYGYLFRPKGMAAGTINGQFLLAVTDLRSVEAWKISGSIGFYGRLGAPDSETDRSGWDTGSEYSHLSSQNYISGFDLIQFKQPTDTKILSDGSLLAVDSMNHRLIKYNASGNPTHWLGLRDSGWTNSATRDPMVNYSTGGLLDNSSPGQRADQFHFPWSVAIDQAQDELFITDYGSHRIIKRQLSTGNFTGILSGAKTGWDTTLQQSIVRSANPGGLDSPRGIALDSTYIYTSEEVNHRVSRWKRSDGSYAGHIGGNRTGWHTESTPAATTKESFRYPSGLAVDGTWLYVADRQNQRISRWNLNEGSFGGYTGDGGSAWVTDNNSKGNDLSNQELSFPNGLFNEPANLLYLDKSSSGYKHNYLLVTSTYGARINRINLNCLESSADYQACSEELS